MKKDEFLKVADFFKDEDAFVCAAYVDGAPATAVQGATEAVIVAALHAIVDAAEHSDNKMKHLVSASYILHGAMLSEIGEKKEEQK